MFATANCPKCDGTVTLPAELEAPMLVRCPLCEAEYRGSEILPAAPRLIIVAAVADMAKKDAAEEAAVGSAATEAGYHLAEDEAEPTESEQAATAAMPAWQPSPGSTARRPAATREKTAGQHASGFLGIVLGGALGLLLGYWALNYFGGPRYDFLHIPLPLVAHTAQHWQRLWGDNAPPPSAPAQGLTAPNNSASRAAENVSRPTPTTEPSPARGTELGAGAAASTANAQSTPPAKESEVDFSMSFDELLKSKGIGGSGDASDGKAGGHGSEPAAGHAGEPPLTEGDHPATETDEHSTIETPAPIDLIEAPSLIPPAPPPATPDAPPAPEPPQREAGE